MDKVKVTTSGGSYEVFIGEKLNIGEMLKDIHSVCKVLIVSDDTVSALYEKEVSKSLKQAGFNVYSYVFPHGEESKTMDTVSKIVEYAAEKELTRTDLMLALGGGIPGDITGFASSIFLRGIDFVQVPTTILSAVDSSVGGKTGVNLSSGKNLAGTFHQPIAVFLNTEFFNSLPKDIYAQGMAEAIKYGMIMDEELFETFESNNYHIKDICKKCIEHKAKIVKKDEFEKDIRRTLNFGHTPAHGIEKLSGYTISHGNAVAIGMVIMTKISEEKGLCAKGVSERLIKLLIQVGLPISCEFNSDSLAKAALSDKKRSGDKVNIVLIEKIGKSKIVPIDVSLLDEYFEIGLK